MENVLAGCAAILFLAALIRVALAIAYTKSEQYFIDERMKKWL